MKNYICCWYSLQLCIITYAAATTTNKIPLYFSYITTFTGDTINSGAIPIVDRALEEINNSTEVLQNYTLQYTSIMDSKCDAKLALDAFFYDFKISKQPTNIALVGCGCSKATIPVASISHYWNIPQVSFTAMDSVLNNRTKFQSFYRAVPSSTYFPFALTQLMLEFQWKQIVIITQDQLPFITVADSLRSVFVREGWELHEIQFDPSLASTNFPYDQVFYKIKSSNSKVIVINSYGSFIGPVLCEALSRGLKHPEYVYISAATNQWWVNNDGSNSSCPYSVLVEAVNGSLTIVNKGVYLSRETNESRMSASAFLRTYNRLLKLPKYSQYPKFPGGGMAYDAIWSLALGLEEASRRVLSHNSSFINLADECSHLPGEIVPLEQFDYSNQRMGCIFRQSMDKVEFSGFTGLFRYINGHVDDMKYEVYQYRYTGQNERQRKRVGRIEINENRSISYGNFQYFEGESLKLLWGGDSPAYDGSAITTMTELNLTLKCIYSFVALIGILFAIFCLVFNIIFRNRKALKLTSPTLNYIVIVGSILLYADTMLVVHSVQDAMTMTVLCNASFWLFSMGYTTCFAVILSKQWRIYYIFNNPITKKKTIKDWMLLLMIAGLISGNTCILLVGTFVPTSRLQSKLVVHKEKPHEFTSSCTTDIAVNEDACDGSNLSFEVCTLGCQRANSYLIECIEDGKLLKNYFYTCDIRASFLWILASNVYIACLQVVAMFMAFHTRKVKLKPLNDSKEIMAVIYFNSILLIVLITAEFSDFQKYQNLFASVHGLILLLQSSIFLGFIFIPKIFNVFYDPDGKQLFTGGNTIGDIDAGTPSVNDHSIPLRIILASKCKKRVAALWSRNQHESDSAENKEQTPQLTDSTSISSSMRMRQGTLLNKFGSIATSVSPLPPPPPPLAQELATTLQC